MIAPDSLVLDRLTAELRRPVLLLTLAPERAGALRCIAWARERGIMVAMGHTAADAALISQAIQAGITLSTHLGNALPQPQPKFLNPLIAQLARDELHASFIADGIHIPPHALKVLLRAKGLSRSVLITDATAAAATQPGLYPFAGMTVQRSSDGSVRVPGSAALAGSALCLDQAVRNVVDWGLAEPAAALAMASTQPAALLAEVLHWHGITLQAAAVTWTAELHPVRVSFGDREILPAQKPFIHQYPS